MRLENLPGNYASQEGPAATASTQAMRNAQMRGTGTTEKFSGAVHCRPGQMAGEAVTEL